MKWFSVRDYKIPVNIGYIFVALTIDEVCSYTRAKYTHNLEIDNFDWFDEDGNRLSQVTHFCIPEPIPV